MADLRITVIEADATAVTAPLLVLPHFERERRPLGAAVALDRAVGGGITRLLEAGDFRGKKDESLVLYPRDGESAAERLLLVGLGKREECTAERVRRALGTAVRQAERLGVGELAVSLDALDEASERMGAYQAARAALEGAILAAWDFRELKTKLEEDAPRAQVNAITLVARGSEEAREFCDAARFAQAAAGAENLARSLASRPGNVATPSHLAQVAEALGREHGLLVTVLDRAAMRGEGLGALLAVAQGSEEEPRFIVLEYRGGAQDQRPLALVGKGVTFDSGGISIKPAEKMEEMKYDMSGAAAVLGALRAVAELELPINVVGLIPATENLPSGRAIKPGDVVTSHLGKTIEIVNTDAEGRLILADALAYARRFQPQAILDAATLTGAVVVALGNHAIGLMGNDGDLIDEVRAVGQRVGQRCWPLPLWDEYREQLDSQVADIKNTGGRPAGTITAAWFLKEFVGDTPWAHLDIAGTAWRDDALPYLRKGATGVPTRLFVEWVRSRAEAR
ncbi:MAG: leucyl aminopeptidase [Gemmatimonadetes bacterium]|nr:leucyl aminopeptidase [Gemmatimonadota bacterium]